MIYDNEKSFSDIYNSSKTSGSTEVKVEPTSSFGDLEIQKHLYETDLQNIFNDYQKNIANLSQKKQEQVQDAYYIKEMSKKYLGEYASNTGIGDVSGNLVDIFANYQNNIQEINQNFDELELGLQQTYQQEKQNIMENLMINQYNMDLRKMDEFENEILFNITSGKTEGMSPFDYLEKHKGELTTKGYQTIYSTLYQTTLNELVTNLTNGFYGYTQDENGQNIKETDPVKYLEQYKSILNTGDFNMLLGSVSDPLLSEISYNLLTNNYPDEFETAYDYIDSLKEKLSPQEIVNLKTNIYDNINQDITTKIVDGFFGYDENGKEITFDDFIKKYEGHFSDRNLNEFRRLNDFYRQEELNNLNEEVIDVKNPYLNDGTTSNPFYDIDFDVSYLKLEGEDVSKTSDVYKIGEKNYVKIDKSVEKDTMGQEKYDALSSVFANDISAYWQNQHPDDVLNNNDVAFYNGFMFMYDNGNWHRLVEANENMAPSESEMFLWNSSNKKESSLTINKNGGKADEITYNNKTYVANDKIKEENLPKGLIETFVKVHGKIRKEGSDEKWIPYSNDGLVVFYQGDFWYLKRGNFYKFEAKE